MQLSYQLHLDGGHYQGLDSELDRQRQQGRRGGELYGSERPPTGADGGGGLGSGTNEGLGDLLVGLVWMMFQKRCTVADPESGRRLDQDVGQPTAARNRPGAGGTGARDQCLGERRN